MNGISRSFELQACLGRNLHKIGKDYLLLLKVKDKEDLAEGDIGVLVLPSNRSLNNTKVTSSQIRKIYNGLDFIPS